MSNQSKDIVDFKGEVASELNCQTYESLKIWKMFSSKKSNLPNHQRIQNLSWRLNSISNSKKLARRNNQNMIIKPKMNLNHIRGANSGISNEEFDYIEHIRKMSKEEFDDYNNTSLSKVPLPVHTFKSRQQNIVNQTNPINIHNNNVMNIDHSPETANSLTSNSNSIFSSKYDHSLSVSSQFSNPPQAHYKPELASIIQDNIDNDNNNRHGDPSFDIENFLDFDNKNKFAGSNGSNGVINTDENNNNNNNNNNRALVGDSNFNEFDLVDLTKLDVLSEFGAGGDNHDITIFNSNRNHDVALHEKNFSLSNYINSLERAVKEENGKLDLTNKRKANKSFANKDNFFHNQDYNSSYKTNSTVDMTTNTFSQSVPISSTSSNKQPMRCHSCNTTTTPLWRKSTNEKNESLILCNACGLFLKLHGSLSKRGGTKNGNGDVIGNVNGNGNSNSNSSSNGHFADDQMGEVVDQFPNKRQQFDLFSIQKLQAQQHLPQQRAKASTMVNGVRSKIPEGDYDWLKFGL
ncbi:hypothetical protein PACTADRAFT_51092 [Pachysolen tannophilus NRRL Y-2460]|uniref:GATA-type domain-containing protein n=1 Tax=Pachysolen tannophilus NRRL Y-2460 TaxID=669874 RepID=A0A1E4TR15_PACTA|nr:hypothetical protein PACTADRAFT_51092 [Pachysolen tannophilus NRRL Y-2460]